MSCGRHQDLMSDYIEDALSPPLRHELEAHLESCEQCRALAESIREVVAVLGSFRAPEPSVRLEELVLERSRPVLRAARESGSRAQPDVHGSIWRSAVSGLAAAAVLAFVLLWRPPEFLAGWSREVSRTAHQSYSFGVKTYHRTTRWLEELNVLRMTVGVAFENRLDRLNERLRDLEEARRRTGGEDDSSRSGLASQDEVASSSAPITRSLL